MELAFQRTLGVLSTAAGYAQGKTEDPTYEDVCGGDTGHSEVVEVKYDPQDVSFDTLLRVFFDKHDPTQKDRQGGDVGTQYRSGIYYTNEEQKKAAEAFIKAEQAKYPNNPIVTEVEAAKTFYRAEEEHQQVRGGRV